MPGLSALTDHSLAIIFATSPTGLGHLRVTKALYEGLPPANSAVLLGAQSPFLSMTYRFISIHPLTRRFMEFSQIPPFESITTFANSLFIRTQTQKLYQQLQAVLNERFSVPKTVLLVASHSLLGHQLGKIKDKLARETGMSIVLVVQVTDDSPQTIWYVPEADMIFVPSEYTRRHLLSYAKQVRLVPVPIHVGAYPISPFLAERLSPKAYREKQVQLDPFSRAQMHITMPISGAAVGTRFTASFIEEMHRFSRRYFFHIISRDASFTQAFIQDMTKLDYVNVHISVHDRTTVENYEQVFAKLPIALEITKPSEQAFKALLDPKDRGGVILLFSQPVGRQEYDNLHFLKNHGLMPHKHENAVLWKLAKRGMSLHGMAVLKKAQEWRALLLPNDPKEAAQFSNWCLQQNLFMHMMAHKREARAVSLQANGVEQFWQEVVQLLPKEKK